MKKEKAAENLEKQGRGLTVFLKILGVILLLLNLLLLDQEFVPWGQTWEELKLNRPEETVGMTDKELWETAKEVFVEEGVVPVKSGFLCWGVCLYMWNEQKAEEAERERLLQQADENVKAVMTTVNEFLTETGIKTDSLATVYIYFYGNGAFLDCSNDNSDENVLTETEKEKLKKLLSEAVSLPEEAAAKAYILGEKCTAAAFAFKASNILEGTDCPYLDENGHFGAERLWGYGWSEVGQTGWLIRYVDEVMLDDETASNKPNQE